MVGNETYGLKGNNKIKMNQATVVAALQLWVDNFVVGNLVVKSVKPDNDNYREGFEISIESNENES